MPIIIANVQIKCLCRLHLQIVYFYAEVDSPNGREYSMRNEEIQVKLGTLIDTSEKIEEVSYYTNPLNNLQLYKGAVKPTGLDTLWGTVHHAYSTSSSKRRAGGGPSRKTTQESPFNARGKLNSFATSTAERNDRKASRPESAARRANQSTTGP